MTCCEQSLRCIFSGCVAPGAQLVTFTIQNLATAHGLKLRFRAVSGSDVSKNTSRSHGAYDKVTGTWCYKVISKKKRVCPCHVTSSCCLERVPEKSSGRGSWNIVVKKGSWHVVRKRFVTCRQEGVPDMLSGRGSWHIVRKGFLTCCGPERAHDMLPGRGSYHIVRKGF